MCLVSEYQFLGYLRAGSPGWELTRKQTVRAQWEKCKKGVPGRERGLCEMDSHSPEGQGLGCSSRESSLSLQRPRDAPEHCLEE